MTEHIKMPDIVPIIRYLANGVQAEFTYPFPIFASEDLLVYLNGARQISGFTITGAGQTAGGSVVFAQTPAESTRITLERKLPLERLTDYIEGGDFSATSINTELDYLVAAVQQVSRQNARMLRYGDHETAADVLLPPKSVRAGKALGFNGMGDPVAITLEGAMAVPEFTATGEGAVLRSSTDKLAEAVSILDFGAAGDGLTDDTIAFQNALQAHDSISIPNGSYIISEALEVTSGKALIGAGQGSKLIGNNPDAAVLQINGRGTMIADLRIEGGLVGIKLAGVSSECTQNTVRDVQIIGAGTGILLDGAAESEKPCYWNYFSNILIE
ncbi:MAG: glycosyl hydrolase family 28-related protein [Alphaproteobacteria bacterium]